MIHGETVHTPLALGHVCYDGYGLVHGDVSKSVEYSDASLVGLRLSRSIYYFPRHLSIYTNSVLLLVVLSNTLVPQYFLLWIPPLSRGLRSLLVGYIYSHQLILYIEVHQSLYL